MFNKNNLEIYTDEQFLSDIRYAFDLDNNFKKYLES